MQTRDELLSTDSPTTGQKQTSNALHIPELDALRAIAILSVFCLHWLPPGSLINRIQDPLSNGVHLFFVLSGLLITRILIQSRAAVETGTSTRSHSIRQFYARRFLRIFPAYYLALIIGAIFNVHAVRTAFWWHATYLSNFYYFHRKVFDGPASPFWTLSVEEQFYLVWPIALIFLPRRMLLPFVFSVALLGTVCRVDALLADSWARILLSANMNFLAVGSLLAVAESELCGSASARERLLLLFGVLIGFLACFSAVLTIKMGLHTAMESPVIRAINQPMMSMLYTCVFAWVTKNTGHRALAVLRVRPMVYLGKISYGLYLYHQFVNYELESSQRRLGLYLGHAYAVQLTGNFAVRFTCTVCVASASWFLFEKPLNKLKRFFPYAQQKTKLAFAE